MLIDVERKLQIFFFLTFISRSGFQSRCQSELILREPAGGSRVSRIRQMCSEVHLSGRTGYYQVSERQKERERESPNIAGVLLPLWSPTLAGQRGEYDTSLPPTSVYDYHPLLLYNSEDCTPTHASHAHTSPHTLTHTHSSLRHHRSKQWNLRASFSSLLNSFVLALRRTAVICCSCVVSSLFKP